MTTMRDEVRFSSPYGYFQFCVGPGSPEELGRGAYHWLTGTAAWMLRAMVDFILGVHPEYEGLRINPSLDPNWPECSVIRCFRGARYNFHIRNPQGVEHGVCELLLDGCPISGTLLPLPTAPVHQVEVVMG